MNNKDREETRAFILSFITVIIDYCFLNSFFFSRTTSRFHHRNEDLLKRCHLTHNKSSHPPILLLTIKHLEGLGKRWNLCDLEATQPTNMFDQVSRLKHFIKSLSNSLDGLIKCFLIGETDGAIEFSGDNKVGAVFGFEVLGSADASHHAVGHDHDTVGSSFSFIHRVRGENDGGVGASSLSDIFNERNSSEGIHAGAGLVQEDEFGEGVSAERDLEFSLLTTTVAACLHGVGNFGELDRFDTGVDVVLPFFRFVLIEEAKFQVVFKVFSREPYSQRVLVWRQVPRRIFL